MASKELLSQDSYERQIAGLTPWNGFDRPTSTKPIKIFLDQDEKITAIAEREGKSRADIAREAIDFFLSAQEGAQHQESTNAA